MTTLLLALFLSAFADAAERAPTYTALAVRGAEVFASVKVQPEASELHSHLVRVDTRNFKVKTLKLPQDLTEREVVALLPAKEGLLVVTQYTIEQGDEPLVHFFDPSKQRWSKIGKIACPQFDRVRIESKAIQFSCEEVTPEGTTRKLNKSLSFGGRAFRFAASGEVLLPLTESTSGKVSARLEGQPFDWRELSVRAPAGEKRIAASAH